MANIGSIPSDELMAFETGEAVEILKNCGITEGMTVLDMGCGYGQYTFPASIAVGAEGSVIAVDSEKETKVLEYVKSKALKYNLKNIICLKTNEKGLSEYKESIDFIILYDVFHCIYNYSKKDWGITTKHKFIETLVSLLKSNGIFSFALFNEIEHKKVPVMNKNGHYWNKTIPINHEEAIQPYLTRLQASGLNLYKIVENGGVHFDDLYLPNFWRDYSDIKLSSLERRNIYNFTKK